MEKLLKNFNLQEEVSKLLNCYFEPPFDWSVYGLGIYKYDGQLHSYCNYTGQGIEQPIYDGAEYIIDILEQIHNYFDISLNIKDYTEDEIKENINFICENILEDIRYYEQ